MTSSAVVQIADRGGRAMYVRKKVEEHRACYQLVEGRREVGIVRPHIVCSQGQHPDPLGGLKAERRSLARHRRRLRRLEASCPESHPDPPARVVGKRRRLARIIGCLSMDMLHLRAPIECRTASSPCGGGVAEGRRPDP
jgi:hypothetical protein